MRCVLQPADDLAELVPLFLIRRDDDGEVTAAVDGSLPHPLVAEGDVQGMVHCHTTYSDGKHSVEEMARAAEYGPNSLRALTEEQIAGYFRLEPSGRYRLRLPYREGVEIAHGNLLDPRSYRCPPLYDAIFCRNVLIYFSEAALHRAIDSFAQALAPGGLLFLGHSESIIGLSPHFTTVRFRRCLGYRRVGP